MTEVETHKARKAHRCEWCWQRIDEGTDYKQYRYFDGGEAATIKMHPECMEAMQEEAAYWGVTLNGRLDRSGQKSALARRHQMGTTLELPGLAPGED